ncbi:MAG: hypothetical protein V3R65_08830 [Acidiferrobacterales bacterium]
MTSHHIKYGLLQANKTLHLTAFSLRSKASGELGRYSDYSDPF